jgi:hypothetical protein
MNPQQVAEKQGALRKRTSDFGLNANLWDGETLAAHIERAYGVTWGARQCGWFFRQGEFRLVKPRPLIARADPARQSEHKKTPIHDQYFTPLDSVIVAVEKEFTGWALGLAPVRRLCAIAHRLILGADLDILENVANLEQLPPKGAPSRRFREAGQWVREPQASFGAGA